MQREECLWAEGAVKGYETLLVNLAGSRLSGLLPGRLILHLVFLLNLLQLVYGNSTLSDVMASWSAASQSCPTHVMRTNRLSCFVLAKFIPNRLWMCTRARQKDRNVCEHVLVSASVPL